MEKATTTTNISGCETKFTSTCLLLFLALVVTVSGLHGNCCSGWKQTFFATENMTLQTSSIWLGKVRSPVQCVSYCHADPKCQSVNYLKMDHLCQLNNATKSLFLDNVITDRGSIYYGNGDGSDSELLEAGFKSDYSMTPTFTTKAVANMTDSSVVWKEQDLSVVGKPSTQSSLFYSDQYPATWLVAGRANDGDTNVIMARSPHCSHTAKQPLFANMPHGNPQLVVSNVMDGAELNPWWRVDLGGQHWLGRITVVNRGFCCGHNLVGATVRAGLCPEKANNTVCGSPVSQAQAKDGAWIDFVCDPRTLARYVSVDINTGKNRSIQICEVMVKEYVQV